MKDAVEKAGSQLVFVQSNPQDAAWKNRPAAPQTPAVAHPLEFSGKESAEKRAELANTLKAEGVKAMTITLPEEICWLLNVRGNDVPCTPFTLSYAIAHDDGTVDWYIDQKKVPDDTRTWVGDDVRIHDFEDFAKDVAALAKNGGNIWVDPNTAPVKVANIIAEEGGNMHNAASPLQMMKSLKNDVEIQGATNAHIRDGAAVTRFLAAVLEPGMAEQHDEITASDMLEGFRAEQDHFKGLSFNTISGAGPNSAIVHYRSSDETKLPLNAGPIYLVDSGGQYLDGTTDITRTIAVAPVTDEMKEHFTRVLKGHIQVAMATFPEGTAGDALDTLARASLKEKGLDYAHGTGHGVGSYLSVHEGPQSISPMAKRVAFQPGMVVSNEPGYYKEGAYGIRIESLVTVIDTGEKDENGKKMLGFKTLTMAPIDQNLIAPHMLTDKEVQWLNDYHADVRKNLTPLLENKDPKANAFLQSATAPINKPPGVLPKSRKKHGFFM
ncbi:MAG: aminopeptidase family protein P [Alphaproteobacteria bacterium]|nr:aminopeptidase family protein P [Alphaproteobacteria bacterium]